MSTGARDDHSLRYAMPQLLPSGRRAMRARRGRLLEVAIDECDVREDLHHRAITTEVNRTRQGRVIKMIGAGTS